MYKLKGDGSGVIVYRAEENVQRMILCRDS